MIMNFKSEIQNGDVIVQPEEQLQYKINHLVSANKLKVYIRIELIDKEAEVKYEDILNYLSEYGIVYGIREEEIKNYCKNKEYTKELIAAVGKEPIKGKDAQLIYDFNISNENKLREKEDGTIDFKELNNIINVKKDEVLCHIIPAQAGVDGIDVYGEPIKYREGKNVTFNYGKNTYISEDGLKLLASTDGSVELKNGKVFVDNVYRVNNVDNTTGNIDFVGSVVISGDVKEGFSVTAKGSIKIRGMVEGAYIKSDDEVIISKGMNGMGKGTIYAKGNITSKYIENAFIETEKSVYAEALINSEVKAKDSIILKGSNAAIIGGISQAEKMIYAKTIGSKTNPETILILDLTNYQEEQKLYELRKKVNCQLEKDISNKSKEITEIENKLSSILNSSMDHERKNTLKKKLLLKKIQLNNEINNMKKQLTEAMPTRNIADHKIICTGIMYSNTRISIGWMRYKVRNDISHSKVYNDGNDITIMPLNPGDLE